MDASQDDINRQQIEQEAREQEFAGELGPEQDRPLPDPQSDPDSPEPQPEVLEHVDVPCAGCGRQYGFDIQPNTETFTFICKPCGTRSEWNRT